VASLSNAVVGALLGARLAVATIGQALAIAKGRQARHVIKQVDRFFSNTGIDVWKLFASWVLFVVGPEIIDHVPIDRDRGASLALERRLRLVASRWAILSRQFLCRESSSG
jgi:hypothetical protein